MAIKRDALAWIIQIALVLAFAGYYVALFTSNTGNISTYTNLILIFTCSDCAVLAKKKIENTILDVLIKINGVLLIIWILIAVIKLFV